MGRHLIVAVALTAGLAAALLVPASAVITATNDQLTLTGFHINSNGADHGLIAHPC